MLTELLHSLPPGSLLMLGALALPLMRGRQVQALMLLLPVASYAHLLSLPDGHRLMVEMFGYELVLTRIDALSMVWGHVFHIVSLLAAIYALHVEDRDQHAAALVYAGSAIAAAFVGDLVSLFVFWELTAVSSVVLIWARRTGRAMRAGMRYLIIQVGSGVMLLAGTLLHVADGGSLAFDRLGLDGIGLDGVDGPGSIGRLLIFLAFGIKAAFPLLHNWLQDAYPKATVTGTVFLSAFTTKLAIYALARAFPGTEILIPIGAAMTLFPIFYAVIENDLRKVLAYSLNNQLGFMVVGVGIGTEMALNGTAAHAFAHILYKSLLFMAMGAVLHRVGHVRASDLGGLYKSMPWTTVFCIIGSLSISGFPLFSGFVSKSMILTAAGETHILLLGVVLLIASAGVVDHSGIKIPFFAFFAHDQGLRVKEAPRNMLIAMGGTATLCIALGVYPKPLYALLPYPVDYVPYTTGHVVQSLQLLLFAALAFVVLFRSGRYPPELRAINLDSDWFYRRLARRAMGHLGTAIQAILGASVKVVLEGHRRALATVRRLYSPDGPLGDPWPTGTTVFVAALLLLTYLLLYYL